MTNQNNVHDGTSNMNQSSLLGSADHVPSPAIVPEITFVDAPQPLSTDDLPIRGTSLDLIDLDKVIAHIAAATARSRYHGPPDPVTYLLQKKCIVAVHDTYFATRAGILCFGRQPQTLMPRAVVDLGHYRGLGQLSFDVVHLEKDINGTLFEQMARVESYLTTNTHHGMTVIPGSFQRVEIHEYPPIVIRELCANMLAHRDYEHANSASRVMLFRDRIEWATPGGLPPNVTIENLLDAQYSRNPVILSIFFEAGYVEAFGQGLDTVFAVLKAEDMEPPYFRNTGESFIAGVYGRPMQIFGSDSALPSLNEYQRRILAFIRQKGEVTPGELKGLLPDRAARSLGRDTKGLVDAELIEATGGSKAIRYRVRRQ
jgi:predicted HTH transcriptional regulator